MNSKLICRSLLLGVLSMTVSCQSPWLARRQADGASASGIRTARAEDALRLAELAAIEGWQSREVSFDMSSAANPVKLVYQVPGESDLIAAYYYPTASRTTMVLALKHMAKTPLQLMQLWRDGSLPAPATVYRREIDPAPSLNAACNWNPALENLKPGNTVLAVWPSSSGNASFDPISTNFRARLVLVVPPKP